MVLLIDGLRGIYVPKQFADRHCADQCRPYSELENDLSTLRNGPDDPEYWDAWDSLLNSWTYIDGSTLYQDQDVWVMAEGEELPTEWDAWNY